MICDWHIFCIVVNTVTFQIIWKHCALVAKFEVNRNEIHVNDIQATFPICVKIVTLIKKSNWEKLTMICYCHVKIMRQ